MEKQVKIGLLYMTIGLLTGIIISLILIDNYYQKQLAFINIQYKKYMEELVKIPEIVMIENQTCPDVRCPEVFCDPCQSVPSFMTIAESNIYHEYVLDEYDCTEFSNNLVYELRKDNYKARVVHGYYYSNGEDCEGIDLEEFECRHDWVCLGEEYDYGVCIEAVTGELIPHESYGKYYIFEGEGKW